MSTFLCNGTVGWYRVFLGRQAARIEVHTLLYGPAQVVAPYVVQISIGNALSRCSRGTVDIQATTEKSVYLYPPDPLFNS